MSATRELYDRARPVIDKVLELTRERQSSLVSEACGADEELARLVRSLLRRQGNFAATDDEIDVLKVLSVSLDEDALPDKLGSYTVIGRLGAGGMSVVYLAEQPNPRRLVALKVLRRAVSAEILQHEVETLSLLRHPGIAQIYEAGIAATPDGNKPFFVMEFVSSTGETRATTSGASAQTIVEYVAERTSWGVRDRLEILAKVCDAVTYAHKRGVIHRDLKPMNVLIDHLGQPKVIDFGIAMFAGPQHVEAGSPLANVVAGTLPYMSPEQLKGGKDNVSARNDVYALGVMAYQLLTGLLPFDGLTGEWGKDHQILHQMDPIPLSARSTTIPTDVCAIVAKATAKDAEARYQTAAELASDIRKFSSKQPISARKNTLVYRGHCLLRRRPFISVASMVGVVLISLALLKAYNENAGAKDAFALLLKGMEQVDPVSIDGSPPTLDRMLDGIAEDLDQRKSLHRGSAAQLHVLLGSLFFRQAPGGDTATLKAVAQFRNAGEILEEEYGSEDERTLQAKNNLAMALSASGNLAEAAKVFESIGPLRERSSDARGRLATRGNYAISMMRQGQFDEAMKEFGAVFDGYMDIGDKFGAVQTLGWQANVLMKLGRLDEAEDVQRDALGVAISEGPEFNELSVALADGLAQNLMLRKEWQKAKLVLDGMRSQLSALIPEHTKRRAYFLKLWKVQRELGNTNGMFEAKKEIDLWDTKYGRDP